MYSRQLHHHQQHQHPLPFAVCCSNYSRRRLSSQKPQINYSHFSNLITEVFDRLTRGKERMPVRNLSSTVRFKTSDASPDVRRRYGLYDDDADAVAAELDQHSTGDGGWRQDQRLKDGITSVLHRLELDSVKPGFDVLSQTGFRRGYQVRGRKPSRRHSYIEPRSVVQLETREHTVPIHEERTVRFTEPEPVVHRHVESSYSPTWYYTEPRSYSYTRSTSTPPARRTIAAQPEGHRALSEYRDTLVAAPRQVQQRQRWSVYGATPSTDIRLRSRSTPPDVYRPARLLPVGDRLSRRSDHEHAIGVKLAESQTDLDTFSRLLDRRFGSSGGGGGGGGSSYYGVYPSYPSTYYTSPLFYDYSRPVTTRDYSYDLYSPRTRVVKPSGTVVYGSPYSYSDFVPYTSTYSRYIPYSHVDYGRSSYSGYEPGYASYVPRSGYYAGRSRYLL